MRIEVKGWRSTRLTPEDTMADMLRYDEGTIESVNPDPEREHFFVAVVNCEQYTKARWDSFGLRTKIL